MNRACLVGRLTRDPELRYTNGNIPVVSFTIAINRIRQNANGERDVDFINVTAWRNQAENIKKYLTKGSQVGVEGRIQTGSYDAKDGTKRYTTEVVADSVQFLETKAQSANRDNSSYDDSFQDQPTTTDVSEDPFADFGSNIEINDDDLPF